MSSSAPPPVPATATIGSVSLVDVFRKETAFREQTPLIFAVCHKTCRLSQTCHSTNDYFADDSVWKLTVGYVKFQHDDRLSTAREKAMVGAVVNELEKLMNVEQGEEEGQEKQTNTSSSSSSVSGSTLVQELNSAFEEGPVTFFQAFMGDRIIDHRFICL
jgi:hypothetical protein